jgi:hypothetical protein
VCICLCGRQKSCFIKISASSGLVLNDSRNSGTPSNFGNDSDTSSAYGESQDRQQILKKNRFFFFNHRFGV